MKAPRKKTCFVIMPFGVKEDANGKKINFDIVHEFIIKKAVEDMAATHKLDIACVRCDEIEEAGPIHVDMFEHIAYDDIAVVDITTLNPNVFYELGIRHSLRNSVTVMIKRRGSRIPFNVQGLRAINYDPDDVSSYAGTRERIQRFIATGLMKDSRDSPILGALPDLQVRVRAKPITQQEIYAYRLRGTEKKKKSEKRIAIVTGDIRNVKCADVWVNSENTNMQMARFYDGSISGTIRYMGAEKDEVEHVMEGGDLIAGELKDKMAGKRSVHAGTVLDTTSGRLAESNGVQRIYHAAAVEGVVGGGYQPVRNIQVCVTHALERAATDGFRSILIPLLGTGTGGGTLRKTVERLFETAIAQLSDAAESSVEEVFFLAWSEHELAACLACLDGNPDVVPV